MLNEKAGWLQWYSTIAPFSVENEEESVSRIRIWFQYSCHSYNFDNST